MRRVLKVLVPVLAMMLGIASRGSAATGPSPRPGRPAPVFFIGTAYPIHGHSDVPLQPVSHRCVRIPMHIAQFFHTLVAVSGQPVYIRR